MPFSDTLSFRPRPEALRHALRLFVYTAVFCVFVAAVLTLAMPSLGSFWRNLWFSECIGLWVSFSGALVRQLPAVRKLPDRVAMLLSLAVGIPPGYVLGTTTGYTVLGEPVPIAGLSNERFAAITATVLAGSFLTTRWPTCVRWWTTSRPTPST